MEYYGSRKDIVLQYTTHLDIDKSMILFCNHTQRCQHRGTLLHHQESAVNFTFIDGYGFRNMFQPGKAVE